MSKKSQFPYSPWLVLFCASLFFYYDFIQMNMLNAMSHVVMQTFKLNATTFGQLSAYFFYANVLCILPAGQILDRFSTRKVVIVTLSLSVFATFIFSGAINIFMANLARFLAGIASAFCFLSCIRLASRWFPPQRLALLTGLVVTMAMLGGMTAQTPMTLLTTAFGWRSAVFIDGCLGVIILLITLIFVHDYPKTHRQTHSHHQTQLTQLGYWQSLRLAYLNIHNWLAGAYTCFLNLPIFILGGFLGNQYLHYVRHISYTEASFVTSMLFIGCTVGSPVMGWLSDRLGYRRLPMLLGAALSLLIILLIMLPVSVNLFILMMLFLLLGFVTSSQVISYPTVAESNSPLLTAMSVSVVSISVIAGGAIFNPLFGWLIDWHAKMTGRFGPPYSSSDFQFAIWLLPVTFILGFLTALLLRETYCRRIND